ncbi:GerMN domain-containing protein [Lentzea californiensis]|uniref:GerMN domain-containing protein n=1 Tax=Lentzea californiensis TaxID=438851 RepID=UPI0021644C81|nr:GerMN domain-containing protein [Lentzea californiensis]
MGAPAGDLDAVCAACKASTHRNGVHLSRTGVSCAHESTQPHEGASATANRPRRRGNGQRKAPERTHLRELGLAALVLAVLTACGIRPTDPIPGLEAPSGAVENTSPSLFWVSSDGGVVPVGRPEGSLSGFDVVALLAQGPTNAEQARSLSTEVPFDAAPATVDRVANGLDVNLSSDVSQLSGAAVQQIVCTLLAVQPVGTVNLRGGGRSLELQKCA